MRSILPCENHSIIKVINDEILAATGKRVFVLNGELETVKCYNGKENLAKGFDGNEKYIALAFHWYYENLSEVRFFPRNGNEDETTNSTVSKTTTSLNYFFVSFTNMMSLFVLW